MKSFDQSSFNFNPSRGKLISVSFLLILLVSFSCVSGWLFASEMEESVEGYGQMMPEGKVRRIMSPLSGVVAKIYVQENQEVKAGEVLAELNPEISEADENNLTTQLAYLKDESNALKSAYSGSSFKPKSDFGQVQNNWLNSIKSSYQAQEKNAKMQIDKSQHLYKEAIENLKQVEGVLAKDEEMLERYQNVYKKGGITQNDLTEKEKEVLEKRGQLAALKETLKAREAEVAQANESYRELVQNYNKEVLGKIIEHQKEIIRFQSEVKKNDVSKRRQIITAPIDGIINEEMIKGSGEVVSSGEVLMSLVPLNSDVVAEVKVLNRDLSYIKLGQKAALRIDAFPYSQFGRLEGEIVGISPSTSLDKEGRPYYVIRIKPNKSALTKRGDKYELKSGMTLRADIITRKRNIVSILSEPVQEAFDQAFRDPVV